LLIAEETPLEAVAERVLSAHGKFRDFEYDTETEERAVVPAVPLPIPPFQETGDTWFAAAVATALERIRSGAFQKTVLARKWQAPLFSDFSTGPVLEHLRERFPACHTFSFSNGTGAVFLGSTPERLAGISAGILYSEALAGTAPRGTHAAEDARLGAALLASDKEYREHTAVVDAILADLHNAGVATARVEGPARLALLPGVQHLRTPLTAALPEGVHLLDIAAALHPTPAVGGAPRAPALAFIREVEPTRRGLYAAPLGWFDAQGEGLLLVGIRSALAEPEEQRITLCAGAGIVSGAIPERELLETEAKSRVMRDAFHFIS
jgi:menaquinone-specific isochorismate synthase